MDTPSYKIIRSICDFLDGLFFGFCIVTLLALVIFFFFRKKELQTFINYSIVIARNLAILFFVLYSITLITYYSSKEFDFFNERARGPYALGYWFMLLRPLVFCGLLQLFWIKKIATKMRYVALITFFVLIISLFSGSIFERFVIIFAAHNSRDFWTENSKYNKDIFILIASYIIEKSVLYSALVFVSWAIFKGKKLD
jgi:hypothetical protein